VVGLQYDDGITDRKTLHVLLRADLSPYDDPTANASIITSYVLLTVMPSMLVSKKKIITTDKSDRQTATISAQPQEHLYPP
jgi:hypothetical protein